MHNNNKNKYNYKYDYVTNFNVWNRDVNGATNIYRIAKNAINGLERPKYLCREKKEENIIVKPKKEKVVQKKANKSVGVVALTKS